MVHRSAAILFFSLLLPGLIWPLAGRGQAPIALDKWPARLQLYPRDASSQCAVAVSGRAPAREVKAVSLLVLRNRQRFQYARTPVDSLTGRFAFKPVIRAELSEYRFSLFAHRASGDSVQVAVRDSVVCGDVFLIMGQSNAVGGFDPNPYRSEFCRSFGVNRTSPPYNPSDTAWCLTNTSEGLNSLWGVELQRLIKEKHDIPTAVITGAVPSTNIMDHVTRTEGQPGNLNTLYGRLYYRVLKAGVAGHVRAIVWRQGEAEAQTDAYAYERLFPQLYRQWKQDYPGVQKVYHAQINLLTDPVLGAGALRDYQRRSKAIFADNEPIATVGLPGYQGIHYGEAGYRQFGAELYRLVARDFYGSTDTSNIRSPNIQRIFYSTPRRDEITLEFEPGQVMRWTADTVVTNPAKGNRYTRSLTGFMYTNYPYGETDLVQSATEQGNRLILKLTKPVAANHLTYLPSYYQDPELGYYVGPYIRNARGMRAFSFFQVPIADPLPVAADLRAVPIDTTTIKLLWGTTSVAVDQWLIERAESDGDFRQLARIPGYETFFDDRRRSGRGDSLRIGTIYRYRIRSLGRLAEAGYSPVVSASMQVILGTEPANAPARVRLVPNPARDQVEVRLPTDWQGETVLLTLTNEAGATVLSRTDRLTAGTSTLTLPVQTLPAGSYILTVRGKDNVARQRLTVSH